MIESCGLEKKSRIMRTRLDKVKSQIEVIQETPYDSSYFGEGISFVYGDESNQRMDNIFAMTWRNGVAMVIDKESFEIIHKQALPKEVKEGWGAASSESEVYLTDGSSNIHVYEKKTMRFVRDIQVQTQKGTPITNLNDLAYFKDEKSGDEYFWCNIFMQDSIVKIEAITGKVLKRINLRALLLIEEAYLFKKQMYSREYKIQKNLFDQQNTVLNGIAYDEKEKVFYITGKLWKFMYKIKLL